MRQRRLYSIDKGYWLLPFGFGLGSLFFFMFFFPRHPLQLLKHTNDSFPYPVVIALSLAANGFVAFVLVYLLYTRLVGLLWPRRVEGLLEECSTDSAKATKNAVTLRVSGQVYGVRFNQTALNELRALLGRQIRLTLGVRGAILTVETPTSTE